VTSRYILQRKFPSEPTEGSTVIEGVSFTQVGLRLSSEERWCVDVSSVRGNMTNKGMRKE